jgi:hypothetical protein
MASTCVQLIHRIPGRWRYRLHSATVLNWDLLESQLQVGFPATQWQWRLNRQSRSLVLQQRPASRSSRSEAQQMGWQALVAAMERCGATEPPPEVVLVKVKVVRDGPRLWQRWLLGPLNLATLMVSRGLITLAALLAVAGLRGLLLPMSPGFPLLLLALLLVEFAFRLRSPFVTEAVG